MMDIKEMRKDMTRELSEEPILSEEDIEHSSVAKKVRRMKIMQEPYM